jgi:predicted amidohydrolase
MDCRVSIQQTNPRLGDLRANLADHLARIETAEREGAQLVLFPELTLTGYFLKDQVSEVALELDAPEIAQLVEKSRRISIAVGFVEKTHEGRFTNSLAFLEGGAVLGVHHKVHLVAYGVFDETRDFAAGESFRVVESKLGRFGPLLCEDFWHAPSAYAHFMNDADALLVASASPLRGVASVPAAGGAAVRSSGLASQRAWEILLRATAILYRTWVVFASRVGWEDGVGFGGESAVIDPFGELVSRIEALEPGSLLSRIDAATLRRARVETPLRRDEKPWILASELARHVPLVDQGLVARVHRAFAEDRRP